MTALRVAHADIIQLISGQLEVCAASQCRLCILGLIYVTGDVHPDMWLYASPVYIPHNFLAGPITPGRLDRIGSTIAAVIALAHANILQLFSGWPEVFASNGCR